METVSPIEIKAGQVCGKIREQDIDAARFSASGHLLDMKQTELLRQQLKFAYKDVIDHEICTTYVSDERFRAARAIARPRERQSQRKSKTENDPGARIILRWRRAHARSVAHEISAALTNVLGSLQAPRPRHEGGRLVVV
jgi:hypothetical protein